MSFGPILLHLDGSVEDAIGLALADSIDVPNGFVSEIGPHVAGQDVFATGQLPTVEVMDLFDRWQPQNIVVKVNCVNVCWGCFHYYLHAVKEDWHCRQQH